MEAQALSNYYPRNFLGNPNCPFDDFFGEVLEPKKVSEVERSHLPSSLFELTDESASILSRYMDVANDGFSISRVLHELLPILWILDERGRILLSVEEVFDQITNFKRFPLARGIEVPEGFYKLGHPSLIKVKRKRARIAGELIYDPDEEFGIKGWVLTNSSGRFGYGAARKEEHLLNVASAFDAFGIAVDIRYYPPVDTGKIFGGL